jgi:hypothetical protein
MKKARMYLVTDKNEITHEIEASSFIVSQDCLELYHDDHCIAAFNQGAWICIEEKEPIPKVTGENGRRNENIHS